MGYMDFFKSNPVAKSQDKRVNRMPKQMRNKSASPQGNKSQTVGTKPRPAPSVNGALRGHDRSY